VSTDIEIYCDCMEQVLPRIHLVESVFTRIVTTGNDALDAEIVFLQFRKMLEQIAFASLVANKSAYSAARAKFATDWRATKMLKYLRDVNPHFYPKPYVVGSIEKMADRRHVKLEPLVDGFLTEENFVELYDYCCDILHTRNPYSAAGYVIHVGRTARAWLSRIHALVRLHRTQLITGSMWMCAVPDKDGKVHTYSAEPM
jgi:hypothetical protein